MDILQAACDKLGVSIEQVLSHRLLDDVITLVIDYGIAGGKKFAIDVDDLLPTITAVTEPLTEVVQETPKPTKRAKRG